MNKISTSERVDGATHEMLRMPLYDELDTRRATLHLTERGLYQKLVFGLFFLVNGMFELLPRSTMLAHAYHEFDRVRPKGRLLF